MLLSDPAFIDGVLNQAVKLQVMDYITRTFFQWSRSRPRSMQSWAVAWMAIAEEGADKWVFEDEPITRDFLDEEWRKLELEFEEEK